MSSTAVLGCFHHADCIRVHVQAARWRRGARAYAIPFTVIVALLLVAVGMNVIDKTLLTTAAH